MILGKRTVRCSRCGAILSVPNPQKVKELKITCVNPNCTNELNVEFENGETELPEPIECGKVGKFIISSQEISLDELINVELVNKKFTFGRAAQGQEHPDVGIVTEDSSMSRIHCHLEIRKLESGMVKTIISEARKDERKRELRPLKVNGIKLYPNDKIVLRDGDNIKMGNTIVRFSQK